MEPNKQRSNWMIVLVCVLLIGLLVVGSVLTGGEQGEKQLLETVERQSGGGSASVEKNPSGSAHLRDNDELYTVYDDSGVVTMYLTVSRGNDAENTNHSWSEINHYSVYDYDAMGVPRYQVNALLQVGDENGPLEGELGYGEEAPNATVQVRGQTSSKYNQKNYKIKLKKDKGSWRGQRTIALNKHQEDGLRFRNKLAYDLMRGIPQMMSLRTQFVHLYVRDLTGGVDNGFEDYGLYTQVEQLNKTALQAHGLDSGGHLYKVEYFEFFRYEDIIKTMDDPDYDATAFEDTLETKGDHDHRKLIKMLNALNDTSLPIDEVLDVYFDRENIQYWLAFHILIGNIDTTSRNLYLYSPRNLKTWYLLSWDNDASFSRLENKLLDYRDADSWEIGISNYWNNQLFKRCLQSDTFRAQLDGVINQLRAYLNQDRIGSLVAHYRSIVESYLWRTPDIVYARLTPEQYDQVAGNLPQQIEENYQLYLESLKRPMPFYIGAPEIKNGMLRFVWDASYDFEAEDIRYTVEVSDNYDFSTILFQKDNLVLTETETAVPPPGQYFVRVRATNASGYTQDAFDYYSAEGGKRYGMRCFYVTRDGRIVEDTYAEN